MGKRKIGSIYGKPIVEGDLNLVTPNEKHKSELQGGGEPVNTDDITVIKGSDYYWKSNIDIEKYDTSKYQEYLGSLDIIMSAGNIFNAYFKYKSGTEIFTQRPLSSIGCIGEVTSQNYLRDGDSEYASYTLKLVAFRESDFTIQGLYFKSIVDYFMSNGASEEEAVAQMKEMGWDRITKEEYQELTRYAHKT